MATRKPNRITHPEAREAALRHFASAASEWTAERIMRLNRKEIEQLRVNALERNAPEVASLCDAVLKDKIAHASRETV